MREVIQASRQGKEMMRLAGKLGKLASKHNSKTLLFSKYLTGPPTPPEKVYREYKIADEKWGMYGNDQIGDCTFAGAAHMIMNWTAHSGKMFMPAESEVIQGYSAVSGYDPATGMNDNGCAMTDVLEYLRSTGLGGHKILGWANISTTNIIHQQQALWLFGALYVGVQLPENSQDQFNNHENWEAVDPDGGIEGGHCIVRLGYGRDGTDYCSWGFGDQKASNAWDAKYVDEIYAVISQDWINAASQKAPNGFDVTELTADLAAL